VITSRRPAEMISFIVWKNSSCVDSLPAMNWTSSIISRSAERSCCLNEIVSLARSAAMKLIMNFSADIKHNFAPGRWARFRGRWRSAVGLAAPGAAMDEERVEERHFRAGERAGGV
jgi:hypothetical protein